MVNTEDFIKKLESILDYYSLSASNFADKIGVQRSSLSHLLSGRNKPSLDFILKIIEVFPEVDLYWILNGKGSFPKTTTSNYSEKNDHTPTPITEEQIPKRLFSEIQTKIDSRIENIKKINSQEKNLDDYNQNKIEKIVIFYSNGKFEEYNPK